MSLAMSTKSLTKRAKVLARNPAPNLMLGMLVRGTVGSELMNCGERERERERDAHINFNDQNQYLRTVKLNFNGRNKILRITAWTREILGAYVKH